jgi:hypothetical protein
VGFSEGAHPDVSVDKPTVDWLERMPKFDVSLFMEFGFADPHPPFSLLPVSIDECVEKDLQLPDVVDGDMKSQSLALQSLRRHHASADHSLLSNDLDATDEQLYRMRV